MGQPKGKEQGTRTPLDLRVGIDVDRFIGVHTERDPGAIPRNALQRGRNIRLSGGMPVSRGGQDKVITSPIDSAWDGLYDAGCGDGSLRLYLAGLPVDSLLWARNAEGTGSDKAVYGYRSDWSPVIAGLADEDPYRTYELRFFKVGNDIYAVGYEDTTLHFFSAQLGVGENPDVLTLLAIDEASFASDNPAALSFNGSAFFATNYNGIPNGGVYRYDIGGSVVLEAGGFSASSAKLGENGTDLYYLGGVPADRFLKRNNGAYTLLSYPAALDSWEGTGNAWGSTSRIGARIGSGVYFVGGGYNVGLSQLDVVVVSIIGTTVDYQTVLTNTPLADVQYEDTLVSFNGLLYWLQKRSGSDRMALAQSNGTSYSEPADFTSLFGIPKTTARACLVAGSANLYLIASTGTGSVRVYKSAGTDVTSWSLLGTYSKASTDLTPGPGSAVALQ